MAFRHNNDPLFTEGHLGATLDAHFAKVQQKVDSIERDQFLASRDDEIVEHVVSEMTVNPLVLHEDASVMDQEETRVDVAGSPDRDPSMEGPIWVAGTRVTISIPWSGDASLWKLRPDVLMMRYPRGSLRQPGPDGVGYLDIVIARPTDEGGEAFKRVLEGTLKDVRDVIKQQREIIDRRNGELPEAVRTAIRNRREHLKRHENLSEILQIPLRQRPGAPPLKPISVTRRLVRPLPSPPKAGFKPEPGIVDSDYEDILTIIRHEGRTFETTPNTYRVHDEEELRNILLAHLNGHFQGAASGETFRKAGKTDIRIEDGDRVAFVAECKVWRGPKELGASVDQLLGYLTWRDCKTALVIFNKHNARFTAVLAAIPTALSKHGNVVSPVDESQQGEWRYVMRSNEDPDRLVTVHIFAFNLYAA